MNLTPEASVDAAVRFLIRHKILIAKLYSIGKDTLSFRIYVLNRFRTDYSEQLVHIDVLLAGPIHNSDLSYITLSI